MGNNGPPSNNNNFYLENYDKNTGLMLGTPIIYSRGERRKHEERRREERKKKGKEKEKKERKRKTKKKEKKEGMKRKISSGFDLQVLRLLKHLGLKNHTFDVGLFSYV